MTCDTSRDVGVLDRPGQGEVGHGATQALGDLGELLDLFDLGFALWRLELLDIRSHRTGAGLIPRILGDTIIVLAGEQARREGRPNRAAVS